MQPASESTPLSAAPGSAPRPKCNDAPWAILFLVNLAGMIALGVLDLPRLGSSWSAATAGAEHPSTKAASDAPAYTLGAVILVPSIITGCITAYVVIMMMAKNAKCMFNTMFGLSIGLMCADVVLLFMTGTTSDMFTAIMLIIIILFHLFFWCAVQAFLPFAVACVETCITFLTKHPTTLFLGFISLVPLVVWLLYSGLLMFVTVMDAVIATPEGSRVHFTTVQNAKITWIAFSFYWTQQVIQNIVHVSVCGAFASWYFNSADAESPVWPAVGRACTWSFGSISLGSLLVAIIRTLRFMLSRDRAEGGGGLLELLCNLCADCILQCLEQILELFNKYAFTYIAIYGQPFCEAGKSVLNLFERKGLQTLINDDVTSFILTLATIIGGASSALLCWGVAFFVYGAGGTTGPVCALCGFVIGAFIVFTFIGSIDSAVATLFVCFAENPDRLQAVHPANYVALKSAWDERYIKKRAHHRHQPGMARY